MTRIGISTLIVRPGLSGSNEPYLVNLIAGLQVVDAENEYLLFVTRQNERLFTVPDPRFRLIRVPRWAYHRGGRIVLDQLLIPFWARRLGAAVLHYPGTVGSLVSLKRLRQVVTVHYDLDPAHTPSVSLLKRAYYATLMRRTRQTASAMLVPSHSFGRGLASHWAIPDGQVHVVYHGVRAEACDAENVRESRRLLDQFGLSQGYLLSVTSALPHKNVPCLLKAYALLASRTGCAAPLVLVGDVPTVQIQGWTRQLEAEGVKVPRDRIILTGFLSSRHVGLLYRSAALMVTATLTESSSMPVLEAMANGCPVVATDIPVHREIGGDSVLLVAPGSASQMAAACCQVLEDPARRAVLIEHGLQRAARFSWERTARETMDVYSTVL